MQASLLFSVLFFFLVSEGKEHLSEHKGVVDLDCDLACLILFQIKEVQASYSVSVSRKVEQTNKWL